jgi:hypothetical protein
MHQKEWEMIRLMFSGARWALPLEVLGTATDADGAFYDYDDLRSPIGLSGIPVAGADAASADAHPISLSPNSFQNDPLDGEVGCPPATTRVADSLTRKNGFIRIRTSNRSDGTGTEVIRSTRH